MVCGEMVHREMIILGNVPNPFIKMMKESSMYSPVLRPLLLKTSPESSPAFKLLYFYAFEL
jgi:hypothetical protein